MSASESESASDSSVNNHQDSTAHIKPKQNLQMKTTDLALSKSSFQQMLMNFNSKVASNDKHNLIKTPKSILKKPRNSFDINDFDPPASSTQNFNLSSNLKLLSTPNLPILKKVKREPVSLEDVEEEPKSNTKRKRNLTESDADESHSYEEIDVKSKKLKYEITEHVRTSLQNISKIDYEMSETKHGSLSMASKLNSILNNFEETNGLIRTDDFPSFSKDIISNRYETFLLQVPKTFEPKNLIGFQLSLSKKVRIKYDGVKYDCIPTCYSNSATFLNDGKLDTVYPKATVVIKQHIKQGQMPEVNYIENNSVAFPHDLKERHPLFGADYEASIILEEHIRDKLKAAVESHQRRKEKEKRQLDEGKSQPQESHDEEIFHLLNGSLEIKSKKSKKKKNYGDDCRIEGDNDIINKILLSKSLEILSSNEKKKKFKKSKTCES